MKPYRLVVEMISKINQIHREPLISNDSLGMNLKIRLNITNRLVFVSITVAGRGPATVVQATEEWLMDTPLGWLAAPQRVRGAHTSVTHTRFRLPTAVCGGFEIQTPPQFDVVLFKALSSILSFYTVSAIIAMPLKTLPLRC